MSSPLEIARDRFVADARDLATRVGEEDGRTRALRADALEILGAQGLPTTKVEEWRYTSVAPLARLGPGLAPAPGHIDPRRINARALVPDARRAVVVDGRFVAELSNAGEGCLLYTSDAADE